jgi:hypothetical protein
MTYRYAGPRLVRLPGGWRYCSGCRVWTNRSVCWHCLRPVEAAVVS